jgi:hypothetical protein
VSSNLISENVVGLNVAYSDIGVDTLSTFLHDQFWALSEPFSSQNLAPSWGGGRGGGTEGIDNTERKGCVGGFPCRLPG